MIRFVLIFAVVIAFSAQVYPPLAQEQEATSDTLVVQARLIEIPGTFAPNDLYNYVYIMKYRVLSVEQGAYPGKTLLVGHYNPLIPRKRVDDKMDPLVDGDVEQFKEGAKHRMTLIKPLEEVWSEAVEDEYFDYTIEKYYAIKADVIK